jgi:hypothetical protein
VPDTDQCPGSDHRAPATGGSCPCGMVTRIPARRPAARIDVREVLAACLIDGPGDATVAAAVQQRAERILAALSAAGLVVGPQPVVRRTA